jgi:hypothetical protein
MLDSVYDGGPPLLRPQHSYIRDSLESLGQYLTVRRAERSTRELAKIFGGTALTGELCREYKKYCADFKRLVREPRRTARAPEVWAAPARWQEQRPCR